MPRVYAAKPAQSFHVAYQMCRRVVAQFAARRGFAGTALIEKDDPITGRVEELPARRGAAAARSAVKEHHRNTRGIAALLPVEGMDGIDLQPSCRGGCDRRIQVTQIDDAYPTFNPAFAAQYRSLNHAARLTHHHMRVM